jgi:hypothetical protein
LNIQVTNFFSRIGKVFFLTFQILGQCFFISMCLCDAHLLIQGDLRHRTEACTELVIAWEAYRKDLANDKGSLVNALKNSQELIDLLLEKMNFSIRVKTILEHIDDAMNLRSQGILGKVVDAVNNTIKMVYQKDKLVTFGFRNIVDQSKPEVQQYFPYWAGQEVSSIKEKSKN